MLGYKGKSDGAHFTPRDLARLVAERVAALVSGFKGPLLRARSGLRRWQCVEDRLQGTGHRQRGLATDGTQMRHGPVFHPCLIRGRHPPVGIENDEASLRARQKNRNANERSITLIGFAACFSQPANRFSTGTRPVHAGVSCGITGRIHSGA